MAIDPAREAAANKALELIKPHMVVGLGSRRAVFSLIEKIGQSSIDIKAVVASSEAAKRATAVGIELIDINDSPIDIAFDGADEVDPELNLIKGRGAALLREKLVISRASYVVICAEENKYVKRLGETRLLPIEIVKFGHLITIERLKQIVENPILRLDSNGEPLVTDEYDYIVDAQIGNANLADLDQQLNLTLGVVEHGLFLNVVDEVLMGQPDGTVKTLKRVSKKSDR